MNTAAVTVPDPTVLPVVTVNWQTGAVVTTPTAVVNLPIVVGVPGPAGADGTTVQPTIVTAVTAQASVHVVHPFPAPPRVTVLDAAGAESDTDVAHTPGNVYLTFAAPFTGSVVVG